MSIHEALKIMRTSKGWTQEETADKLRWGINTYAQIERGEVDIKCAKLRKFADTIIITPTMLNKFLLLYLKPKKPMN